MNEPLFKVEFHCHTLYSPDSRVKLEDLIRAARRKQIHRVVVTDHNKVEGARLAHELAPDLIIVGEEVMTTEGEILAAFVKEKVEPGLTPEETIVALREQGAFISVSHPFDRMRKGAWSLPALERISSLVDAIEVFNSRCANSRANEHAARFAREHHLPGTAGSDAHALFELGRSTLLLPPFTTADELRLVIRQARQVTRLSPYWVHLVSRFAKWTK